MPGEGSVFQRASDSMWVAQISIGPRGTRKTKTKTIGPRKPTRKQERAAIAALKRKHLGAAGGPMTTGAYLERWVNDARNIRPNTRHGYSVVVTHHLTSVGSIPLASLTPLDVDGLLKRLEPTMSAKSLRNVHAVLRRALGQAVRADLIERNPASREYVDAPRVPSYDPAPLCEDEVARLLAAARGDRLEAVFVLAVGTGLRQGELLGLEWQDVTSTHVRVRQTLAYREGRYHRDPPKTEASKRLVPLAPSVVDAMVAHRERVIKAGFVPTSTGPVFTNLSGKALSGSWVTHHFYGLLERAGIKRVPFKNLRTTYGSRLYDSGVPEPEINALMGHTRERTGRRHYIARGGSATIAAVDVIERLVNQSPNQSRVVGEPGRGVS